MKKIAEPMKYCKHPEHNPPMYIVLEPGTYEHECPDCGVKQIVNINEVKCYC